MMRDTDMTQDWINAVVASTPCQQIINPTSGLPTDNFLFIARAGYCVLTEPQENQYGTKSYSLVLLLPPEQNLAPLLAAYDAKVRQEWPRFIDPATNQPQYGDSALVNPFRLCDDRRSQDGQRLIDMPSSGYTPGCYFSTAQTQYKPPVVDARNNPIIDPAAIYSGMWVAVSCNWYAYPGDKSKAAGQKKGVRLGLQAVMKIADDKRIGGGGPVDAKSQFGGVDTSKFNVGASQGALAAFGGMSGAPTPGATPGSLVPSAPAPAPMGAPAFPTQPVAAPAPAPFDPLAGMFGGQQ